MWRPDVSYPPLFQQPNPAHKTLAQQTKNSTLIDILPLIDLQQLNQPSCANQLAEACREWGIFRLKNHGIPATLTTQANQQAKKFFSMPFEAKQAQLNHPINYFWGSPFIKNTVHNLNWLEGFHIPLNKLSSTLADPVLESFRDIIEDYGNHMTRVARKLFATLAENLQLDPAASAAYLSESEGLVRIYRYPLCAGGNGVLGLEPHTDSSVLSILNQDQVGGLQILRDGRWIDVDPVPDTLVVNLGDITQAISNDEYKSVEHRVLASDRGERVSICYFGFPFGDTVIKSSNYREFSVREFQAQVQEDVRSTGFKVGLSRFKLTQSG